MLVAGLLERTITHQRNQKYRLSNQRQDEKKGLSAEPQFAAPTAGILKLKPDRHDVRKH
jgi:hypothetical protein